MKINNWQKNLKCGYETAKLDEFLTSPELFFREVYLRTIEDLVSGFGIYDYTEDQIKGINKLLEKFVEFQKELEELNS